MIPAAFDYERATSIDDALARLQRAGGDAKLLAGGHSLVPLMKLRLSEPAHLIDIARIPELAGIRERDGEIDIGAATVHHDVATSDLLQSRCPMLAEAAAEIGDPQVRHRGTLGGSLAHADPAADYPAVVLALDATIHLRGPKGARAVPARDFFKDLCTVDLATDEIIISISFKPVRSAAYSKLHQRASHFAIVGVAAALTLSDSTIQAARIGVTGATTHAVRLAKVEAALTGRPISDEVIRLASELAGSELPTVNADLHAGEKYRRAMIPVFTRRALEKARSRSEQ
jgi:carbon-monoxide dehydrogenase medium subunit